MSDFIKGMIVGSLAVIIIVGVIAGLKYFNKRERTCGTKEIIEYAEKHIELQELREDIINRPPDEFLEVPNVQRAADGAAAEFDRKRDEALQRLRNRVAD
jgi:hypothetical protein